MSSKQQILSALRQHTRETYDMPDLTRLKPITYDDPVAEFKKKTTTIAGASLIEISEDDDLNAVIRDRVVGGWPASPVIATNIMGIDAQLNPDTVASAQELERVDVGIVRGDIGDPNIWSSLSTIVTL